MTNEKISESKGKKADKKRKRKWPYILAILLLLLLLLLSRLQKQEVTVTDKVSAQASFSSGAKGSIGTWEVENPSSNTVIMQCEIMLDGETMAKSAPIYPGQHIDSLTLSKNVTPGNHSVTAAIKYYNKTTKAYLGMADYKIRLSVS